MRLALRCSCSASAVEEWWGVWGVEHVCVLCAGRGARREVVAGPGPGTLVACNAMEPWSASPQATSVGGPRATGRHRAIDRRCHPTGSAGGRYFISARSPGDRPEAPRRYRVKRGRIGAKEDARRAPFTIDH
eukprot:scaffold188222_cov30-Tisochrysis_lutea.AAC.2